MRTYERKGTESDRKYEEVTVSFCNFAQDLKTDQNIFA